jgi:hypothetical protein
MRPQRVCHDILLWLISFSLDDIIASKGSAGSSLGWTAPQQRVSRRHAAAALYFMMTSDNIMPAFVCAFYNFLVQGILFTLSPLSTARREILSLVTAAVFVATIPTYTAG